MKNRTTDPTSETRAADSGRIPTLDGWRAVAILGVLLSHSNHMVGPLGPFPAPAAASVFSWLRLGVDLFFAISGFLITTLLVRERAAPFGARLAAFYTRRAFRILPLILTYLCVLTVLDLLWVDVVKGWELVSTLLFARNYVMHWAGGDATNHFWSLSVEEHFYLLWPPLLLWLGPRRALSFAVMAALATTAWRALDTRYELFQRVFSYDPGILFRTDTRYDALLWGAAAGLATPWLRANVKRPAALPATALILLLLVGWIGLHLPLLPLALAVLFPLLILSTVLRPASTASRTLESRWLVWIGQRSYSLYVWQTLFLQIDAVSLSRRADLPALEALGRYALDLALIVLFSSLTHRFVELPAQRFGRALSSKRTAAAYRSLDPSLCLTSEANGRASARNEPDPEAMYARIPEHRT